MARAVAYSATHGHRLWSEPLSEIDPQNTPPNGIDYSPSHEFIYKLARLQDQLITPTARRLAVRRHQVMIEFFQRLDAEVLGNA